MAAPNLVNISTITAKSTATALGTTSATVLTNPSASNKVFKVNAVTASNNGTATITISLSINKGGTNYFIGKTLTLPANGTLIVVSKDSAGIYLEEGDYLAAYCDTAAASDLVISYEELS